jgi:uncharacterized protein
MPRSRSPLSLGLRLGIGIGVGVAALTISVAIAAAAASVLVARKVVEVPRRREEDIRILAHTDTTITLSSTDDTRTPGRYGLFFHQWAGHVRLGDILSMDDVSVTRELVAIDYGDLASAARGRFSGWFYLSPRELGLAVEDVVIDSPLGAAPAWLVPAEAPDGRWVIQVHGRGVTRAETIRAVPVFHEAGYTSLLISYRNDGVAPDSDDRRYALGGTEWRDLEAAIDFAVDRGATSIVLMGWSMGGATSLQGAIHSRHRARIRGIVLDSPVVDWRSVLHFQASAMSVPLAIRSTVLRLIGTEWGGTFTGQSQPIDLDALDLVTRAEELTVPTLILHSADDGYVPADASRALALLRPDIVSYDEFTVARHAKLWNYDEPRWSTAIRSWLTALDAREAPAQAEIAHRA